MNVLHYIPSLDLAQGGVVRAVLDIATCTAAAGLDVTVATRDPKDAPEPMRQARPGHPRLHVLPQAPTPIHALRIQPLIPLIDRADVLHLHTPWQPENVPIARAARARNTPYVLTIHGMLDDWSMRQKPLKKRLYLRLLGRALLDRAAAVHCTAQFEQTQARRHFANPNTPVIPLLFDTTPYRDPPPPDLAASAFDIPRDRPTVLFLSRLHPKKRPDLLIRTLPLLRRHNLDPLLLIAGSGEPAYTRSLHQLADSLSLADSVRFLGLVTGPEKVSLYALADVFALPTSQENFGFVFPEALACRTPVVTTRGVDIWPELESSGGARIVHPPTPQTLADAIAPLLKEPAARQQMGDAGRRWVFHYLDQDRILQQLLDLYHNARSTATNP